MIKFNTNSYSQEEIERLILGTILSVSKLSKAIQLKPEYFTDTRNKIVFEIMLDLEAAKQSVDEVRISDILKSKGIEKGPRYVDQLKTYIVRRELFRKLVAILKERYIKKRLENRG